MTSRPAAVLGVAAAGATTCCRRFLTPTAAPNGSQTRRRQSPGTDPEFEASTETFAQGGVWNPRDIAEWARATGPEILER